MAYPKDYDNLKTDIQPNDRMNEVPHNELHNKANDAINRIEQVIGLEGNYNFELVANKVSQFQNNPDDTHYPTEKLVKDSLDQKADINHTHTSSDISDFDTAVSNNVDVAANTAARHTHDNKALLDSLTNSGDGTKFLADDGTYKTTGDMQKSVYDANNNGIVDDAEKLGGRTPDEYELVANKVSQFQSIPDDIHYPTEKLVKDSLDQKADINHTHNLNDLSDVDTTNVQDGQALVYDALSSTWKPGTVTTGGGGGFRESVYIAGEQIQGTILFEGAIEGTTLQTAYLSLGVAPSGSSFVIKIDKSTNQGGSYSNVETITLSSGSKSVQQTLSASFNDGDWIRVYISQVGSSIAGSDLYLVLKGT